MTTTIVLILALTVAWYVIWFSVPRHKRGITNAICSIIFGCVLLAVTLNRFNS